MIPLESFEGIQSLIFVFNKELHLSDEDVWKMPWHHLIKKYKLLKDWWKEQERKYKELESKAKSKRK